MTLAAKMAPMGLLLLAGALVVKVENLAGNLGFTSPAQAEEGSKATPPPVAEAAAPAPAIRRAAPASRMEKELGREVKSRAALLDERETALDMRERLLGATEKRLDGKLAELRTMEESLKRLTQLKKTQQDEQFSSLVRLYEKMKPKESARIFERLDMPVQLAVATRMKETKMAAIMAQMAPDAARLLTLEMAARSTVLDSPDEAPIRTAKAPSPESVPAPKSLVENKPAAAKAPPPAPVVPPKEGA